MAESKNEIFEKAWNLYKNKATRVRMEKFLPGVARLFSSGNKTLAEQEFNAEMLASLKGESLYANEMAWIANGKIPSSTIQDILSDKKANIGKVKATETFLNNLSGMATLYFSGNPEAAQNAENFYSKVKGFMAEGYDEPTAKIYAMPTGVFRQLNKDIDSRAGYKYSGEDNRVHSVAEDFAARRKSNDSMIDDSYDSLKTEDLVELAKMFGGNLSNTVDDNTNLAKLDESARELGFTSANDLFDFLAVSEDRSRRLREQDDDNAATKLAKGIALPYVNAKWNEGLPSNGKDIAHDVAINAVALAPQNELFSTLRASNMVRDAVRTSNAARTAFNIADKPVSRFLASKALVPFESEVVDASLGNGEFNPGEVFARSVVRTFADATIDNLTRRISRGIKFPNNSNISPLLSDKALMRDLERDAYNIAYENRAADAAHNALSKNNPDFRLDPALMFDKLKNNKTFSKSYPLNEEQFGRVFNSAWESARRADAMNVPSGISNSLNSSLKNIKTYKKTNDFQNALKVAAWKKAGFDKPGLIKDLRRMTPSQFNELIPENANAALYAKLMKMYADYSKKRTGANWLLNKAKWNAPGYLRNAVENFMTVNNITGSQSRYLLGGAGIKSAKDDKSAQK